MRLILLNVDLFEVVLDFLFHLVLVLQNVLQLVVLVNWLVGLQDFQQPVLLLDDVLDLVDLEVPVDLSLAQVPPQLLSVVLVLLLVFLYLAVQAQIWVVVLLLVELLREERQNVNIRSLFNLDNNIESFLEVETLHLNPDGLNGNQKLPYSVVDRGKGQLLSFESLP